MKLYSPAIVRQVIEKHRFRFQKKLGQNFLIDGNIVDKIVDAAEVTSDDTILEIGAGIGTLTQALAEKAGQVIVVEIDKNLLPVLGETLAGYENIEVVLGNALKTDFDELVFEHTGGLCGAGRKSYKIVANLPYYITTPLLMYALENHYNMSLMVVMIQREVADRITAKPGSKDYGALTLGVNYFSHPQVVMRVPKKVFMPQPEVESTVVRFRTLAEPPALVVDEKLFFKVVRAAFGQRRKTLMNTMSVVNEEMEKSAVGEMLLTLGIDPGRRGETLNFEEFARIANEFSKKT